MRKVRGEILKCNHSNKSYRAVLSGSCLHYSLYNVVLTEGYVSLESYLALFSVALLILYVKEGGGGGGSGGREQNLVHFPKFRFESRKFHVPIGTVNSGCTDTTQAIAPLIKRDTEERYWGRQFVKWKEKFRSDLEDRSKWTIFIGALKYSGGSDQTEMVRII